MEEALTPCGVHVVLIEARSADDIVRKLGKPVPTILKDIPDELFSSAGDRESFGQDVEYSTVVSD
ncbi:hypothetical protein QQX98_001505 [Neonectria punicea]|uniref:Uncharacterized protein n=1 Tax=Neonectria punicea TaxID=979145 RepID=A0ABR1HPG9_9HYPO